jgi:uncharacterized damage-inducible protein DinB
MTPHSMLALYADYNDWANRRLYAAMLALPPEEITRTRPSAFGSLLATLNHGLVADRVWLSRIEGTPEALPLDHILHEDIWALKEAREAMDLRIVATIAALSPDRLEETLSYRTLAGTAQATPLTGVLMHLFNHQTHHRGQAHDMLSQTALPPPALDLIYFLRERGAA